MTRWLTLLAGPLIWLAHFAVIYAAASVGAMTGHEAIARWIVLATALVFLLVIGAVLCARPKSKSDEFTDFARAISTTGCLIGALAIIWQTVPAFAL